MYSASHAMRRLLGGGDELGPRWDAGQPLHDVEISDPRRQREIATGIQGVAKLGVNPETLICGQPRVECHEDVAEAIEIPVR